MGFFIAFEKQQKYDLEYKAKFHNYFQKSVLERTADNYIQIN